MCMHEHICTQTSTPPCLTGRGNGFSPFGEPQTRGAAGPFQIAALLKSPICLWIWRWGFRREGREERGQKLKGGRDQRVKKEQKRDSVSLRCFSRLPCGPWLDLRTGFRSVLAYVCMCVCGANERLYVVDALPEATGQSNQTQTRLWSWDTHTQTYTYLHQVHSPHLFSLSCQPPYLFHSVNLICNHTLTYRAHKPTHQLGAILLHLALAHPSVHHSLHSLPSPHPLHLR